MNPRAIHLPALLAGAALFASCGGASGAGAQPVAVELPPPPPSPDPAPGADPELTPPPRPDRAAAPAPHPTPAPAEGPTPINAPPVSPQAATAEALFREARQLMAQGAFAEACLKLEASHRLDPAVGTLLNLAMCEERVGKKDRACAHFFEAARLAQQNGQPERAQLAQDRFQSLGCQP